MAWKTLASCTFGDSYVRSAANLGCWTGWNWISVASTIHVKEEYVCTTKEVGEEG